MTRWQFSRPEIQTEVTTVGNKTLASRNRAAGTLLLSCPGSSLATAGRSQHSVRAFGAHPIAVHKAASPHAQHALSRFGAVGGVLDVVSPLGRPLPLGDAA